MKKLISILVAFAMLAGAVFAQEGSWSVGGSGQVGARLDFVPMQEFQDGTLQWGHATIDASKWDGGKDDLRGNLNVMYNIGGLKTGFEINQKDGVNLVLENYGDNWSFGAKQNLVNLFNVFSGKVNTVTDIDDPTHMADLGGGLSVNEMARGDLWGNYTFQVLNGIKLETAIGKWSGGQWVTTTIFGDAFTHSNNLGLKPIGSDDNYNANYLLIDVSPMDGLNLGVMFPRFFSWWGNTDFVTTVLQHTRLGAKFATGPVGVALEFALQGQGKKLAVGDPKTTTKDITVNDTDLNSALYLGVQYQISDQMKAGIEFRGFFGGQKSTKVGGTGSDSNDTVLADAVGIKIGASFNYDDGPFGAGITIKFEDDDSGYNNVKVYFDHNQTFKIAPSVYYNIVPEYLQAKLEFELTFWERENLQQTKTDPNEYDYEGRVDYSFTPQLYFNFLGTGAGNWDTGIALKWGIVGTFDQPAPQDANYLQLSFKWSF